MSVAHVVGIDPGIVDTGMVRIVLDNRAREVFVEENVVKNAYENDISDAVQWVNGSEFPYPQVFVEKYRPRQRLGYDEEMLQAQNMWMKALPRAELLSNTGITKVVPQPMMQALGVWTFNTRTHHQDLRSAARIALLGAIKEPVLNGVLSDAISDYLHHRPWHITWG